MSVITLNFEGYVQCRLATDPDPTDERRGVSGYTFALPGEPDLDWTIYTQPGPGVVTRPCVEREVGVKVTSGYCGAQPIVKGHPLFGAPLFLDDGPRFEERNYIVTKETFGVIAPFHMRIPGNGIEIRRWVDYYPGKPLDFPLMETPQSILRPYTSTFTPGYPACPPLLGPSQNPSVYRQERLRKLEDYKKRSRLTQDALAAVNKRIEQLHIDDPRDRRTGQLMNATIFNFQLNGPAALGLDRSGLKWLNGHFDKKGGWEYLDPDKPILPWPINFWMGSWDADSLTFYMGGTVQVYDLGGEFEDWLEKDKDQGTVKATGAKGKAHVK
jgi:hypothetical protein